MSAIEGAYSLSVLKLTVSCSTQSPNFRQLLFKFQARLSQLESDYRSGYDYTMRFIGCDSILNCSFVCECFESRTMIYREFKRIGQTHRTV